MPTPQESRRIARRAYYIWEQEGRPPGRDQENWYQAEKQLEVEFRVGFPDASGDEDTGCAAGSDSDRFGVARAITPLPRGGI